MAIGAPRKKVTIRDVADAAGVSTATVSRAFARPGRVGAETAERIRQIADELGYRADTVDAAQSSSPDELNGMLAITVADISNPVFSDVVKAAQHRCLTKGFGLAVVDAEETGAIERGAMQLMHRHVDGFILASSRASDAAIRKIAEIKPVVTLNRPTRGIPAIIADPTRGLVAAVEQLLALGHKQITYLAGPASSWQDGMRWRVLNALSVQHGFLLRRLPCASPTMAGGIGAFRLFKARPTSAVIAYNDLMAVGFLSALMEHGFAVPGEVSVVGIDNLPTDTIAKPTLSSVNLPRRELGEQAVDELIGRLRHVTRKPGLEPVMLPSTFV
ncbi:LacI family DNA-binding transcriptional regulator [Bifidobacterium oedipodis]|uniref:LacI family transcriptional regulator n=1 Tax=Bifidobacterium oedipodis TaxID=2675322 RepID=A0A7Y0ENT6_9BIFI|nr:LacI family DNA-binding transcriptional regulator [Bifidobacterium sp. DSM 109957]NMM93684.1 LacI family transcriptional regulator [Bifidobacterium sp. DSM 109957]